ncbi:hypothetical protein BH23PSE1_BH23PSE1_05070 [soil metagenome]
MRVFLIASAAVLLLAVVAALVLDTRQHTVADNLQTSGVRLGDPGSNLVEWR